MNDPKSVFIDKSMGVIRVLVEIIKTTFLKHPELLRDGEFKEETRLLDDMLLELRTIDGCKKPIPGMKPCAVHLNYYNEDEKLFCGDCGFELYDNR